MIENIPFANPLPENKLAIEAATKASNVVMKIYNTDFSSSLKNNKPPKWNFSNKGIIYNEIVNKYAEFSKP